MKPPKQLAILYFLFFSYATVMAQERAFSSLLQQPGKLYSSISNKAFAIDHQLDKATEKYLCEGQETRLKQNGLKKNPLPLINLLMVWIKNILP